ncbi:hypothetical protein X798_06810, partial [Onchocerca flexuosa]
MISWTVLNIFLLFATSSAELYSSLASLKAIIGARKDIPAMINNYVKKELERFDYLKKFAQEAREYKDIAIRNGDKTIKQPINAFLLIKGMIKNWSKIIKIARSNSVGDVIRNMTWDIKRINYPTQIRTIDPDHPRAKDNVRGYEYLLENDGIQRIDMRRDIPPINNVGHGNSMDEGVMLMYEALCREGVSVDAKTQSRLYCYYKMGRPYLRLAPFKVEIVRQIPLAALFYDIMSDEEARIIQMLAVPKLNGSRIYNDLTGNFELPSFRTLKSARLKSTEHEIVKRIDRRLELATNLEIETAEDLTMTEPEIGGQTIFMSNLKITIPCIK